METITGRYIPMPGGYQTYLPNPLPSVIPLDNALQTALEEATAALHDLHQFTSALSHPRQLAQSFLMREALFSTKITGHGVTVLDVLSVHATGSWQAKGHELDGVGNYIQAFELGVHRLEMSLSTNLKLLRELHGYILAGPDSQGMPKPSDYRTVQTWVGKPGAPVTHPTYVPPAPEFLDECLVALETYLHDRSTDPLIQIGLIHYQLQFLQPFIDGNGRIARLLTILFLIRRGLLTGPFLCLSSWFCQPGSGYYNKLFAIMEEGNWQNWMEYFLKVVAEAARDSLQRVVRINNVIEEWRAQVASLPTTLPDRIIVELSANPYITTSRIADQLGVAFATTQNSVNKLLSLGIIEEISEKKRGRLYCATALLSMVSE